MDPQLLDYYNRELTYMREAASEFAQLHPKIARRLGMQGVEVADPYVERLIESFCFMSARMGIGFEYLWEVELLIDSIAAPRCRLGDTTQLGWSTWMASEGVSCGPVTGMLFEPESYGA